MPRSLLLTCSLAALPWGCGPEPPSLPSGGTDDATDDGDDDGDDGDDDGDDGDDGPIVEGDEVSIAIHRSVDVLFVVDNTGSMAEEHAALASGIAGFVDALDARGADYRIGITTTDNGNPWCTGTTPEAGNLRLSSCRSRLSEFVFEGAEVVDATATACEDLCVLDGFEVLPTQVREEVDSRPRPWLESLGGVTNLDGDVSIHEALTCALPQGIDGCGFEQPLESMYKALAIRNGRRGRARVRSRFCGARRRHRHGRGRLLIFAGPRGDHFDEWGGSVDPDDAVMRSVGRYIDQLTELETGKQTITPARRCWSR